MSSERYLCTYIQICPAPISVQVELLRELEIVERIPPDFQSVMRRHADHNISDVKDVGQAKIVGEMRAVPFQCNTRKLCIHIARAEVIPVGESKLSRSSSIPRLNRPIVFSDNGQHFAINTLLNIQSGFISSQRSSRASDLKECQIRSVPRWEQKPAMGAISTVCLGELFAHTIPEGSRKSMNS